MVGLQVVTTPTFNWLGEHASACRSRMLICSPYVNDGIIKLTEMVSKDVSRTMVTRTDLRDFAAGSSNLGTLYTLVKGGVTLYSLSALHAKMYIFDDTSALVTSANATTSGMWRNLECGLSTDDRSTVRKLAKFLLQGLGANAAPSRMTLKDLENLYGPLEAIKATLPEPAGVALDDDGPASEITYSLSDKDTLLKGFTGWRRLTLEGVLAMPESRFYLKDLVEACSPAAAKRYPKNRHVPDKLRQQLQMLRTLGIVEFLDPGCYRRTMD